jgi:lipopolysaccharide/colanic/teichoic acid biosynthesis glycosyltransferase
MSLVEPATRQSPTAPPGAAALKRCFDVAASSLLLVLLLPLLVAVAVIVRLDSPGPVVYRQLRLGRGGRPFKIWKFRTMHRDADRVAPNISPTDDPRITRVGHGLRRCYLDELPQLVNVLRGEMSLVGPRPETPEFVALYGPDELRLLTVRPGVMGPSTLLGMTEEDRLADADDALGYYVSTILPERVAADLDYLDHWSLTADLGLICRQVWAILRRLP